MDATVCLPKNPLCPLTELCQAHALGLQEERSVLKPKPIVPHKLKGAAVILRDGQTLLNQRPADGLFGGLWEIPSSEVDADSPEALVAAIEAGYRLKVSPLSRMDAVPRLHPLQTDANPLVL